MKQLSATNSTPALDAALAFVAVYEHICRQARTILASQESGLSMRPSDLAQDSIKKLLESYDTSA